MVLESRPTDNPTALSNLYILAGHENSYWASPRDRTVLRRVGKMPQFGEKTPDFDIRLCVKGKRPLSHWWRDGQFRKRGASSAGLSVALHQQRVHRGPSLHETARKIMSRRWRRKSQVVAQHVSHFSALWTELQTCYLEVLLSKVPLKFIRICDCISKLWEIIVLLSVTCYS